MSENVKSPGKPGELDGGERIEQLEKQVNRLQIENAKKDKQIQKLQEDLQVYMKPQNNTSTDFPWPNEFKKSWENLVSTILMDTFDNIYLNSSLLSIVVNIIVKNTFTIAKEHINNKIKALLMCLNISDHSDETIRDFFVKFQSLIFQQYYKSLFQFSDDVNNEIIIKTRKEIEGCGDINSNDMLNINKDLNAEQIVKFIKEMYALCIYMHLHDPPLSVKTSNVLEYRYFSKTAFINIEGFPKENSACLIILHPPQLKSEIAFKGMKPAVYIVENPSEEIISKCEESRESNNSILKQNAYANTTTPTLYSTNANLTNPSSMTKKNSPKADSSSSNVDKNTRSKSTNKYLPNFLTKYAMNGIKAKKSISPIPKESDYTSLNSQSLLHKAKKAETIFSSSNKLLSANTINKNFNNITNNNNNTFAKRQKCFTISIHEDQKQNEVMIEKTRKLGDYLRFSKSNSQSKLITDKSRNSSGYEIESNHNSSKKSDNNIIDRKLITEVSEKPNTTHFLRTPVPKRQNSNESNTSYKPQNTNGSQLRFNTNINAIIASNNAKRQVKTTIKKISTNTNYLRKIITCGSTHTNTINANSMNRQKINKFNYKNLNFVSTKKESENRECIPGVNVNYNSHRNSQANHSLNI